MNEEKKHNGRLVNLRPFKEFMIEYGCVNHLNLKSVYMTFKTWSTMIIDKDINQVERLIQKKLKKIIRNKKNEYFFTESIVDCCFINKLLNKDEKTFLNIEVTLFVNNKIDDIKSPEIKNFMEKLGEELINDIYSLNYFYFNITKN